MREPELARFRQAFAQTTGRGVFFDNASMGPVAPQVTAAMTACMELRQAMPMKYYQYADRVFPSCKGRLARLMGARPEELVFTENVAYGINTAAAALPIKPGENVILCDREFASNVYPWLARQETRGIEVRIVPNQGGTLTVERLEEYADSRTRAVTVSSVQFSDGAVADLQAIGEWCRAHGAFLVVDCAQSLGVLPMDVKKYSIDMMAGLSSKWLLGPFATGFLYVRRELIGQLTPPFAGADSVTGDVDSVGYAVTWKQDAERFASGLPNAPGVAGLDASLALMEETGVERIQRAAWAVSGRLRDGLLELGLDVAPCAREDHTRSTIISFACPDVERIYRLLRENQIACSLRLGMIRMGVHGYNTREEAEQVLERLATILGGRCPGGERI